jgi:hypothetical protein
MTLDHDLQARPIYHHQRDSIDAHLTIVFAALAVSLWIEDRTGWSIRLHGDRTDRGTLDSRLLARVWVSRWRLSSECSLTTTPAARPPRYVRVRLPLSRRARTAASA